MLKYIGNHKCKQETGMKYSYEAGEKSTVKIKITLTEKEWTAAQQTAYEKTKAKYRVNGFRKGHVPKNVIDRVYGKEVFYEDAVNEAFGKYYYDVLDKETETIYPVDSPVLGIDKIDDKGITMTATVAVKPEVKIGAYKGIKIEKVEYNVNDDDVTTEVNRLLEQHATQEKVEGRAAKNGDITVIDYSGAIDGVKFDGGTAENQNLTLGSGQFIPGFEDGVVGMNVGETKDINVRFPDGYGAKELAGKDAVFTVTLREIKEKKLPELTDEFVKEKTGDETVEAYKAAIRERLEKANAQRAKSETEDKIIKAITETSEVEIPDALIERQIDNIVQNVRYQLMYSGMDIDGYLKYTGKTMEEFRAGYKAQAEQNVKSQLVIDKILTDEKIDATEEEVEAKIAERAAAAKKTVEEYSKGMNEKQRDYIRNDVIIDKLFKFLTENNEIA